MPPTASGLVIVALMVTWSPKRGAGRTRRGRKADRQLSDLDVERSGVVAVDVGVAGIGRPERVDGARRERRQREDRAAVASVADPIEVDPLMRTTCPVAAAGTTDTVTFTASP